MLGPPTVSRFLAVSGTPAASGRPTVTGGSTVPALGGAESAAAVFRGKPAAGRLACAEATSAETVLRARWLAGLVLTIAGSLAGRSIRCHTGNQTRGADGSDPGSADRRNTAARPGTWPQSARPCCAVPNRAVPCHAACAAPRPIRSRNALVVRARADRTLNRRVLADRTRTPSQVAGLVTGHTRHLGSTAGGELRAHRNLPRRNNTRGRLPSGPAGLTTTACLTLLAGETLLTRQALLPRAWLPRAWLPRAWLPRAWLPRAWLPRAWLPSRAD